jgi:hypothetical protein
MIERINKTQEIRDKLELEGKVTVLNSPEQQATITKLNEELAEVRREYKVKERNSFVTASKVVLTD